MGQRAPERQLNAGNAGGQGPAAGLAQGRGRRSAWLPYLPICPAPLPAPMLPAPPLKMHWQSMNSVVHKKTHFMPHTGWKADLLFKQQ